MPKQSPTPLDTLTPVTDTSLDMSAIEKDIKQEIVKRKEEYLSELGEMVPDFIDVEFQAEFLLHGWHHVEGISGTRARWTARDFSFLYHPHEAESLYLHIVGIPGNLDKIVVSLLYEGKKVQSVTVRQPGYYAFRIPEELRSGTHEFTFRNSEVFVPMRVKKGPDTRELGVGIKSISRIILSDQPSMKINSLHKTLDEIARLQYDLTNHENPEDRLPKDTRFGGVKRFFLRSLRLYTATQIAFNRLVVKQLYSMQNLLQFMLDHVQKIERNMNNTLLSLRSDYRHSHNYKSEYLEGVGDELYEFQQMKLRGSYDEVKKRQMKYLSLLKKVKKLNQEAPFMDAGFGRGEFLEILRDEAKFANVIGADTNTIYVEQAKKREFDVYKDDALSFLKNHTGRLSGFSAFHLFEHLTFDELFDIVYLVNQKLLPGGMILIETPNPQNLQVASYSFHYDHTHVKPLAPVFMITLFEFFHLFDIEIVYSSPLKPAEELKTEADKLLFGPQDYAIVAFKR